MSDEYNETTDEEEVLDFSDLDEEDYEEVTLEEAEEAVAEEEAVETEETAEEEKPKRKREYPVGKKIRDAGFTLEQVRNTRESRKLTDEEFGDGSGWYPAAQFALHYEAEPYNIPTDHILDTWGGNRGMFDSMHPLLTFFWYGRKRYFHFDDPELPEVKEVVLAHHAARVADKAARRKVKAEAEAPIDVDYTEEALGALKIGVLKKLAGQQDINFDNEELFPNGKAKATKAQLIEALVRANS
jgi:hypothetical protein